ncbi:CapA family protein [Candidatus Uhrbacteria bacterium]|nr:CapA family protein [Candidatus Uhrbacteria bacterium]
MRFSTEQVLWITVPGLLLISMYIVGIVTLAAIPAKNYDIISEPLRVFERVFPLSQDRPDEPETILFTGDVMLGRYVETLMAAHDTNYPFLYVDDILKSADLTFVNLEGPVAIDHTQTPNGSTSFSFDKSISNILRSHGIDAVALGNNHTSDRGQDDYEHTVSELSSVDIASVGHSVEAAEPIELKVGNETVRFFSFNDTFPFNDSDSYVKMVNDHATDGIIDIVNMHWGAEYQLSPNADQQELAHALIDAGADLIVGHHPHVVQEIEQYNDKLIFYSLGNFIFDQYFSKDVQQGLAIQLEIDSNDLSIYLLPLESVMSQPQLMIDLDRAFFLEALAQRSDPELQSKIRSALIK